jgi:POT family proton-dependent oligopeptide transporter
VALLVFALTAVYAVFIEQYGSSLLLFADRAVDRTFLGIEIHSSQLVGVLPAFLVMIAPLYVWLWGFLDRHDVNPGTFSKFGVAFLLIGLAYAAAWVGTHSPNASDQVGLVWLVLLFFFMAVSDFWIIPIGMSMVSKLSNKIMIGLMMGAYMLALSAGYYISAIVAQYSLTDSNATSQEALSQYQQFFAYLAVSAAAIGIITLLFAPFVRRYLHGVK